MEEKINNQKIFSYVPSLIARLILNSSLQDKDIFSDNSNSKLSPLNYSIAGKQNKGKSTFLTSLFINPSIYPINNNLANTVVMNIRLKGFQRLITTLSIKDPNNQIEKMISEYLSIITPKLLLQISEIISKNGGEIIKYNDYEFTTIWNFTPKKNKVQRYEKFYAKKAILSACQIMKEVSNKEIVNGNKIKISIGIAMGKTMIGFFGGERKRGEYVVMGEAIHKAEICLNYCLSNEIIISEEINKLFDGSEEIASKEIDNKEGLNLYLITDFNEKMLNNFIGFKIKMKDNKLNMTKDVYENLAKKVYIFSSILPQGLVKYLDVGQDQNLKEINVVTICTIHILINKDLINNFKKIQNIILDIQKATYLTFGSLLYISKTYNGLLVRCVWGMDPGSFLDDTARCISTAILIGSLTNYYNIKIGIGITTGSCYTGLIEIQGDRKQFTLMGKKVNLSRTLADEAFQKVLNSSHKKKYLIYCDKKTMKQSQKWVRHIYISKINIYFNKESQELYYESKDNVHVCDQRFQNNMWKQNNINKNKDKSQRNNWWLLGDYNRKQTESFKRNNIFNNESQEITHITIEIYTPVEIEEYYIQNKYDPFPLLRTHKHNSYTPKIKQYIYNHFENKYFENQILLPLIGKLPLLNDASEEEKEKMNLKLEKSLKIYGYDKEINKFVNLLNTVTQKCKKQIFLVKGPLGVGKTLFLRSVLYKYLENNEELRNIYYNKAEFIFFNIVDPLTNTFPYNTFCFILRKIYFYIKKIDKLKILRELCEKLKLDDENIKYINFVLSMGKKDINIKERFDKDLRNSIACFNQKNIINDRTENISYISDLEGPFKIKDSNKINKFFFEMIKIYKIHLNNKFNNQVQIKFRSSLNKIKNKVPLILVVDDVQMSDKYSIEFFSYLFSDEDKSMNPFIVILVERTPFDKNYRPLLHRELEFYLKTFNGSDDESDQIGNDKIISFNINPIMEKDILKNILIENFNHRVIKEYPSNTKIESIDDKILDFLLMKTFRGIPLLVIELFKSLFQSKQFIKMIDNKLQITQELIDDNDTYDWSNLFLPYIYEKITSMAINSLLSFKEILLVKYGCTIGTFFDVQTLDKINPLNLIIKKEDLNNIMEKLNNEYIIEIFENEKINRKTKKSLICKICFPFMREALYKKFPFQRRAGLHAETAKLLSAGKNGYFFGAEIEGKILKRHLIYSEINIVQEIESKNYPDNIIKIYKNTKIMNTNNLTVLNVKDICSRIFDRKNKNVIEGNLEMLLGSKWISINYYVDRQWKLYLKKILKIKNDKDLEYIIPIKDIFKNAILDNNTLEITIAEYSFYLLNKYKKIITFHSDNWKDILYLNTALSFLKMIATYEKYIYNFGYTKFPIYKMDWYAKKEKKYYANIDQSQIVYFNDFMHYRNKRYFSCFGLVNQTDKLITQSKDLNRPFSVIMRTTFTIMIATIQMKLTKYKNENKQDEVDGRIIHGKMGYLLYIPTPSYIKPAIQELLDEVEKRQKEEEEKSRMREKGKFSIFPLSLLRQERRMFGSGIIEQRRNMSISQIKFTSFEDLKSNSKEKEIKEIVLEEKKRKENTSNFAKRRKEKSKTIITRTDVAKELGDKIKTDNGATIKFVDNDDSESDEINYSSKSEESDNERSSNLNESEGENSSQYSEDNNDKKKSNEDNSDKKTDTDKTVEIKDNSIQTNKNDINKIADEVKYEIKQNNIINFNNLNLNKNNNKMNINTNSNYNINNYINNNININLINNNYLDSRLNHSFLNNNILKNNLNINLNSVRMSYQKKENRFLVKSNKRSCVKKSFSAKVRTLKEKYRNSLNYYLHTNPTNKLCEDEDESCVSSDKESENTDSNLFLTPKVVTKKKNSKISEITPIKEDIFSKAMIAFLMEENNDRNNNKNHSSTHYKNIKKISKAEIEAPRNAEIIRNRGKRSSLCPRMNYQFKNKNRHVTFTQRKSDKDSITKNISKFDEDLKTHKYSINNHNIRRIKFNDDK